MQPAAQAPEPAPVAASRPSRLAQLRRLIRAIAEVDATEIEAAAQQLGQSRRMLTPLAWVAGTLVLLINGIKLLILNWRLTVLQLVPASWVWLAMWDLKRHLLHGDSFAHLTLPARAALIAAILAFSVLAYWCNTVFAFAIDAPPPPRIAPAMRRAREGRGLIVSSGLALGTVLAFATITVPRYFGPWVFALILSVVIGLMMVSFVTVPARIIGLKQQKLPPKQALARSAVGGALSAVVMTPGFLMGRIGLILLGMKHFHLLGFVLLSIGTALYAAGMSSVKAVKLSMKLSPGKLA